MDNRDRDKVSRSDGPTEAGNVDPDTSERARRNDKSAEFGGKTDESDRDVETIRRDRSGSSPFEH